MDRPPSSPESPRRTRLAYRSLNRRRPESLPRLRWLLGLILLAQCMRVAFTSPRLGLTDIQILGSRRFTPDQVAARAGIQLGQNIFSVNVVRVSERMRESPLVRDAVVTRDLPSRLRVEVTERAPFFTVQAAGTPGWFLVDETGIVFDRQAQPTQSGPTLLIAAQDLPAIGGLLRPELTDSVDECTRLCRAEGLDLRRMQFDQEGELWLQVQSSPGPTPRPPSGVPAPAQQLVSVRVRLGRPTELPEKIRNLRETVDTCPAELAQAEYLNLMCAGRPALLPLRTARVSE
ncbi:MAG: FtsQ-type POTRA domain-containing protein [Armatimonadetes bacterium]|nr:FtsQ-type POTRA domain-containing protein [Armatimonadota bacterium]